jgi:hypothetical protein
MEQHNRMLTAQKELMGKIRRKPTTEEIAEKMGTTVDHVKKILRNFKTTRVVGFGDFGSLDDPIEEFHINQLDALPVHPLTRMHAKERLKSSCEAIGEFLSHVYSCSAYSERDLAVFLAFYGLDKDLRCNTLEEIGDEFSMSRERVRQIVNKVWNDLWTAGCQRRKSWLTTEIGRIELLIEALGWEAVEIIRERLDWFQFFFEAETEESKEVAQPGIAEQKIIEASCKVNGVTTAHFLHEGKGRCTTQILWARCCAAYILNVDFNKTTTEIAKALKKDKVTVWMWFEKKIPSFPKNQFSERLSETRLLIYKNS